MTAQVFGADYAAAYDELYRDKAYSAECDLVERVFRDYGHSKVNRVLDLGCGTGGHCVPLAERGYAVTGVDRSDEMLRRARLRPTTASFFHGDITNLDLGESFDAELIMFAVLGYQTSNQEVKAAVATARRHTRLGGVLFGDVWYGPAVLLQRPAERVRVIETQAGGQVIRVAKSELDTRRDICTVSYHLWRMQNSKLCAEVREQHGVRYFFAPELELLLDAVGFELLRIGGFPNFDDEPSEQTWNVAFVARAV